MTFAEKLRSLREQAGMTQQQLAEAAEIPLGTLRDYEQGKRRHDPSLATAVKLADAMGTDCRAFAGLRKTPPCRSDPVAALPKPFPPPLPPLT